MTILRQDFEWRVLLPILVLLTLGAGGPGPDAAVELTPEAPDGYADDPSTLARPLRQDVTSLRLEERGGGLFTVRMGTAPDATTLENIDLRPLIPRVPALARGDADLVRYALVQRELNRVETRYGPVTGADESRLANNCLRGGLWEAFLDRKVDSGMAAQFHAWFVFPKDKYSRLFESLNGLKWADYESLLMTYPRIDGMPAPLEKLRKVIAEGASAPATTHLDEAVQFLPEQRRKSKLLLATVRTYGDFVAPSRQPIRMAKFVEPGRYESKEPVTFDLSWLKSPKGLRWRRVKGADGTSMDEIEIEYENGYRVIAGDATLGTISAQPKVPEADKDVLKLTFGIGTPDIYASAAERARELSAPRPNYLLLLGKDGRHVDNHRVGVDRVFLWRDDATPSHLHIWLVGYERIAFVSYLTTPWEHANP